MPATIRKHTFRRVIPTTLLLVGCVQLFSFFVHQAIADDATGNSTTVRKPVDDVSLPPPRTKPLADHLLPPPQPHPLVPAMKIAQRSYEFLTTKVRDYSCRVVKQDRIDGRLRPHEYIDAKVRHALYRNGQLVKPRGVYMKFLHPEYVRGREILWVEGENKGEMVVRRGGRRGLEFLTLTVDVHNDIVSRNSRYPITDMGMINMVLRLIEIGRHDMQYGECEVKFFEDVKVDGRDCLCIQVLHPRPRDEFKYHLARVYVDDEWPVPIHFEAYDWPESPDEKPPLLESYSYLRLRLNVGFTDAEFRRNYRGYDFD